TVSGIMPAAYVGTPFQATVTVTGGTGPFTFGIIWQSLPPGLSLNNKTGVISGTPTTAGSYNFSVSASNKTQTQYGDHRFVIAVTGESSQVTVTVSPATTSVSSGGTQQ